jgi:hypothetical protein
MNEHDDRLLLESRLTNRFQTDSDALPSASTIDLNRARAEGRSLRHRRRAGGAGITAVAGCAIAVVLATTIGTHAGPTPLVEPTTPSLGTKTGVPASEDPLQETLQFGTLPAGFVLTGAASEVAVTVPTASDGSTRLTLLQGSQSTYEQGCPGSGTTVSFTSDSVLEQGGSVSCGPSAGPGAASINWVYKPGTAAAKNQGFAELTWLYAPGSYATLQASLDSMSAAGLIKVMTEVVENGVRTGPATAVAMPFHLPASPAGLSVAYAYSVAGQDGDPVGEAANGDPSDSTPDLGTAAGVEYGGIDAVFGNAAGLSVTVQSAVAAFPTAFEVQLDGGPPSAAQTKSLTVNGHTARSVSIDGYEALVVHDVDGFDIRIAAAGTSALNAVAADGGLEGYFDQITFSGTNPATWTYDVIGH